jgi:TolB-like protein/DNA-binding winged helix-turn-helix (wHTH) protein/Tfp pilus assembly protein PilF
MTRKTASILGAGHHRYSFGRFVLDVERGALLQDDIDIPLRPKCFEVLTYLVKHNGVLVTKDQLMDAVWPNLVVTEDSLTQCLIQIRKVLGDAKKEMIRTIPRRGFIFDVPVTVNSPGEDSEPTTAVQPWLNNRKPSRWSMAVAAVLTLAIVITWWNPHTKTPDQLAISAPALPTSIAVLPFTDMSPAGDQEYFADGLSEEVLNLLAQIPELQVIARTSSFSFKGQRPDIPTIAAQLNVANILEGSVRKDGDRIRVTAQLVSAADSAHLWSKTYDRNLDNPFAVQSEIAESVAGFLQGKLLSESVEMSADGHNSTGYDHYLKGKFFYSRRGEGDNERAMAQYQQALDINPGLAEAWVGMAGSVRLQGSNLIVPWQDTLDTIKTMLDKAIELEPDSAEAHIRLSRYYESMGMESKSRQHFKRALRLGQNDALVLSIAAGAALQNGNVDEAIELQRRAVILDPLGFVNNGNLAHLLYFGGYYEEAREKWLHAAALSPEHTQELNWSIGLTWIMQEKYAAADTMMQQVPPGARRDQGMALVHFGRGEQPEFKAAVERLSTSSDFDSAFYLTEIFSFKGDLDQSFLWLAEATDRILEVDPMMRNMSNLQKLYMCPFLASIREDPRWSVWLTNTEKRVEQIRS